VIGMETTLDDKDTLDELKVHGKVQGKVHGKTKES
jgi:hypothetical protein